mgnify:FL=1
MKTGFYKFIYKIYFFFSFFASLQFYSGCSNELKPIPLDEQSKKRNSSPDGEKGGNCLEGKTCHEGLICSFNNICAVPPQVGSNINSIDDQDESSSIKQADDLSDSF